MSKDKAEISLSWKLRTEMFFFYVGFLSRRFTNHRTAGDGGGHSINSSLPLPPALQTLRHYPGNYCRELTSAHSQQLDSNYEPLVSKRKLLTTTLRALDVATSIKIRYSLTMFGQGFRCQSAGSTIVAGIKEVIRNRNLSQLF